MRQFLILILVGFIGLFFVKPAHAFCIPSFFTGKIVVATVKDIQVQCSEFGDTVKGAQVHFNKDKDVYGSVEQTFTVESSYYNPTNEKCSLLQKNPPTRLNAVFIEADPYELEQNGMYLLKLQNAGSHYEIPICEGNTVTKVSSVTDSTVNKIRNQTVKDNIILGAIFVLVALPGYFSKIINSLPLPFVVNFVIVSIFNIAYFILLLYVIFRILKFLFSKIRGMLNR